MQGVMKYVWSARGIHQIPVRLRSTVSAAQDIANGTSSKPAGWDTARPYSEIPGPKPLPVIGNLWRYLPGGEFHNVKNVTDFFNMMNNQYGSISKMSGIPGRQEIVLINDADEVEHVFRNEGTWPVRRGADSLNYYFTHVRKGLPVSLIASQGKEWQDFRTAVNQVMMQPRNTKQYVEPIDRVSQEFIDRMRLIRNDKLEMPQNFFEEIANWALESIAYVALDTRLGVLGNLQPDSEGSKMVQAVHTVFDSMYKLDFLPSAWKFVATPDYKKFIKSMDFFTEVSTKYVNLAMERLQSLPPSDVEERNYSVLENLLLRTGDPKRAVTMALDMLMAGIDTTGTVVATVMYQLATNPEKQQKLHEELDRIIQDPSKCLAKSQLEDMKYLKACVKETMRVMPIVLGNSRNTTKDMVIAGYQIPTGTMTSMSSKLICDNEKYFPRANEFLPERWLPGGEECKIRHPFAFLPFGFGPRMCVGRRFADLEIETLVAKVFRNYALEWNRAPAETCFKIIFQFTDPLQFTVRDRI